MEQPDYVRINRAQWNERTQVHVNSRFYDNTSFLAGRSSLMAPELALLGDLSGKTLLHLQCHFGQDTLSLARMGAKVTGLDLSDVAIAEARKLNAQLGLDADFVEGNVLEMDRLLGGRAFDVVFTTYGVVGWLPELTQWGRLIAQHLKPGGRLILVEFHPAVWMFDDNFEYIAYSYFNREVITEEGVGTYTDGGEGLQLRSVSWNHSLSEVLGALLGAGLRINHFEEYDYSPYDCFSRTTPAPGGNYYIAGMEGKLPLMYSVAAEKP